MRELVTLGGGYIEVPPVVNRHYPASRYKKVSLAPRGKCDAQHLNVLLLFATRISLPYVRSRHGTQANARSRHDRCVIRCRVGKSEPVLSLDTARVAARKHSILRLTAASAQAKYHLKPHRHLPLRELSFISSYIVSVCSIRRQSHIFCSTWRAQKWS